MELPEVRLPNPQRGPDVEMWTALVFACASLCHSHELPAAGFLTKETEGTGSQLRGFQVLLIPTRQCDAVDHVVLSPGQEQRRLFSAIRSHVSRPSHWLHSFLRLSNLSSQASEGQVQRSRAAEFDRADDFNWSELLQGSTFR